MITNTTELKEIHYMLNYRPFEPQYSRYLEAPEIIAAGYKITDVYTAICQARIHLSYYECDDFGELAPKDHDISMKWARSQMCIDALIYYNICIDLSWQVTWAFYQATSMEYLFQNKYEGMSKECTLEAINTLLEYRIKTEPIPNSTVAKDIRNTINSFMNNSLTEEIRTSYNYIKHRGGYYIPGLGENNKHLLFSLAGKKLPVLSRPEMDMEGMYVKLLLFDVEFIKYFESIINKLMPNDYMDSNIDLGTFINNYHNILDANT